MAFLIIGLVPWNFFNSTILQSAAIVVTNAGIIKKVYFPREILPISTTTSNLINFFITGMIVIAILIIMGVGINTNIVFLPIVIIIQYIFQLGLAFIFSAITVYVRDVEHIITIFMMLMFYLSPVVYSADMIPEKFLPFFKLNPMFHIIEYYRTILYYKQPLDMTKIMMLFAVCVLVLILGYRIFKKCERRFAEEL